MRVILLVSFAILLFSCSTSRYSMRHDAAPLRKPTQLEQQDVKVMPVKISQTASKPYTINGKRYFPMNQIKQFTESGIASWYGRKFHGELTSNGEVYDMFAMSAAHKTLPLPSFIKVINIDNNKSAIVRVNDRGPFHDGRIVDLSYSAAYKLGIYQSGTGNVRIEVIDPDIQTSLHTYIQVAAASNYNNIKTLAKKLELEYQQKTDIEEINGIFKLRLGPIRSVELTNSLLENLKLNRYSQAFILYSGSKL